MHFNKDKENEFSIHIYSPLQIYVKNNLLVIQKGDENDCSANSKVHNSCYSFLMNFGVSKKNYQQQFLTQKLFYYICNKIVKL